MTEGVTTLKKSFQMWISRVPRMFWGQAEVKPPACWTRSWVVRKTMQASSFTMTEIGNAKSSNYTVDGMMTAGHMNLQMAQSQSFLSFKVKAYCRACFFHRRKYCQRRQLLANVPTVPSRYSQMTRMSSF